MTKTKRNLILVVSLLFAIFTLCSVFAIAGLQTSQTVEAGTLTDEQLQYRRDNPGLYETGTTTLVKDGENDMTWKYLIDNKYVSLDDGVGYKGEGEKIAKVKGDLICGEGEPTRMGYAFSGYENLTLIDLSNVKMSNVTKMDRMFDGDRNLNEIVFGESFKNVEVKGYLCGMFEDCYELTSLDLRGLDTSGVTRMECMFAGCKKLKSLNVSSFDTRQVECMDGMFSRCESLTTLDLSNFKFDKVTSMMGMFANMKSLKSLDVSHFNTSKVAGFCLMFTGMNLAELDLRNFDFSVGQEFGGTIGMMAISDEACVNFSTSMGLTAAATAYQKAMNNEDISTDLEKLNEELANLYKQEIVGKTGDELGYAGRVHVAGYIVLRMKMACGYLGLDRVQNALDVARGIFETRIDKIYLPATTSSKNILLPSNTTYVAEQDGETAELEQQILYGYEDLNMTSGAMLIAKTPEVEDTGVKFNVLAIVVCVACLSTLIVMTSKKKKSRI